MTAKHMYFSYGMNTDPEQMMLRTGLPTAFGRALVRDHGFRFAHYADVFPLVGTDAHGVLWELDDDQLASLDAREGFPHYYNRKIVDVECAGKIYQAWMYFMTDGHSVYPPSDSYYSMLDRGYETFGVPKDQIVKALAESKVAESAKVPTVEYKAQRSVIAFSTYGSYVPQRQKSIRWFKSYVDLLKLVEGRKFIKQVTAEAIHCALTVEEVARDYVIFGEVEVPDHFQVEGDFMPTHEYHDICY